MPRTRPLLRRLLVSLVIFSAATIPLAYFLTPVFVRIHFLNLLASPVAAQRARGLSYLAQHASTDPRLLQGGIAKLAVPDERNFMQIVAALNYAGQWRRPPVPDDDYLRWLGVLSRDPDREARILAAQQPPHMPELAADPRILALLSSLQNDKDEQVRYNVLVVAAELAALGRATAEPYEAMIARAADDPVPAIARDAWMYLGLINPVHGKRGDWRTAEPRVAQAILWSSLATNPDQPAPALEALASPTTPPAVRAMAVYALSLSPKPEAKDAIRAQLPTTAAVAEADLPITLRATLAWTSLSGDPAAAVRVLAPLARQQGDSPIVSAAAYRLAQLAGLDPAVLPWLTEDAIRAAPNRALAAVEGLPANSPLPPIPADAPPMLRIAWARAARDFDPDSLADAFAQSASPIRDAACAVAAQRFTAEQNTRLINKLLRDFNDDAKRSGSLLAGLTNLRPHATIRGQDVDLLDQKMRDESLWPVQQVQRLGLWMQGRLPEMEDQLPGLMSRQDLPISTFVAALLARRPRQGLDLLLSPRTDPPTFAARRLDPQSPADDTLALRDLLIRYRFGRLAAAALGPDAPPLDYWADPALQQFQVELLRDWYLLHRARIAADRPAAQPASHSSYD